MLALAAAAAAKAAAEAAACAAGLHRLASAHVCRLPFASPPVSCLRAIPFSSQPDSRTTFPTSAASHLSALLTTSTSAWTRWPFTRQLQLQASQQQQQPQQQQQQRRQQQQQQDQGQQLEQEQKEEQCHQLQQHQQQHQHRQTQQQHDEQPRAARSRGWTAPLIELVFEDDDMLAVCKPSGVMVHDSREASREDRERRAFAKDLAEVQLWQGRKLFPVHRIDRAASGLLLLAKSAEACARVQRRMEHLLCSKRYLVLCRGCPPPYFECDKPLKDDWGILRHALTRCTRLRHFSSSRCSLLEVEIATGRRHQIRRHLNHRGFHVVGDSVHGKGRDNSFFRQTHGLPPSRMFLHAFRLSLPTTSHTKLPDVEGVKAQPGRHAEPQLDVRSMGQSHTMTPGLPWSTCLQLEAPLCGDLAAVVASLEAAEAAPCSES